MNPRRALAAIAALCATCLAFTANAHSTPASGAADSANQPTAVAPQSDGEVRKVDREQGKVTLRHGPIANLDMPPMTMVFKAADPKLIEGLKEGDKVKFTAEKVNGVFTMTAVQAAK